MNDLLCVEYSCPIEEVEIDVWSQMDYIIHVLSGKKSWRTRDGIFEVNTGDTVYIKKGAAFIKQYFDSDFCMLAFFISDDIIKNAITEISGSIQVAESVKNEFQMAYIKNDPLLDIYFQGMLHHFRNVSQPIDTLLDIKFKELIIQLISSNKNPEITKYFIELSHKNHQSIPFVMEQNFSFNLSLEEFAKLSGKSLSTFKREFQEYYSTTPGKWLIDKRLQKASLLLNDEALNISQVAYQSGFKDNSHFGRVFKDKFGYTPLDFRKRNLQ